MLMDQVVFNRVGHHKQLGLTLTYNLNWDLHINNVVIQANIKMSVLYGVKLLDRVTLDLLDKMIIKSRID